MQYFTKILCFCCVLMFIQCKQESYNIEDKKYIAPISIKGLQERTYESKFHFEKELQSSEKHNAKLVSYFSDSLKVYALINTPKIEKPDKGFPILIFGHGFHPEPKKYGVSNNTGKDSRPGDYYRDVPGAYSERGFVAVTPDYRGHNISDGFEYTKTSFLASTYYAIDVLHLITALQSLENVDLNRVYYMGHSMGGDVGLKMLLATDKIKAASLWCGVTASSYEQALYYGNAYGKSWDSVSSSSMKNYTARLDTTIQELDFEYEISSGDPIHFIDELSTPLIIHHATDDTSVPYRWSESLAAKLYGHGKTFEFYTYESKNHLFEGDNRIKAVNRDIDFFNKINN